MSRRTLILSVLITLRLLMPPGICVCKWSSPAARFLAAARGAKLPAPPPPPTHADDDHAPGCPASSLAEGLGVAPPSGPGPLISLLRMGVAFLPAPDADGGQAVHAVTAQFPAPCPLSSGAAPLYVAHCALLF
jgi:hypothetical protein